jgi:acyl-CoA thioester hydrolase
MNNALDGEIANGLHKQPVRVYYEDTDFSGVVYHASYLRFLERGRTEFLRAIGVSQSVLHAGGHAVGFAVRRMTIEFLKPARMDDVIAVETEVMSIGGASLDLAQTIRRDDEVLSSAEVRVACLVRGRPARLPAELRMKLVAAAQALSTTSGRCGRGLQ